MHSAKTCGTFPVIQGATEGQNVWEEKIYSRPKSELKIHLKQCYSTAFTKPPTPVPEVRDFLIRHIDGLAIMYRSLQSKYCKTYKQVLDNFVKQTVVYPYCGLNAVQRITVLLFDIPEYGFPIKTATKRSKGGNVGGHDVIPMVEHGNDVLLPKNAVEIFRRNNEFRTALIAFISHRIIQVSKDHLREKEKIVIIGHQMNGETMQSAGVKRSAQRINSDFEDLQHEVIGKGRPPPKAMHCPIVGYKRTVRDAKKGMLYEVFGAEEIGDIQICLGEADVMPFFLIGSPEFKSLFDIEPKHKVVHHLNAADTDWMIFSLCFLEYMDKNKKEQEEFNNTALIWNDANGVFTCDLSMLYSRMKGSYSLEKSQAMWPITEMMVYYIFFGCSDYSNGLKQKPVKLFAPLITEAMQKRVLLDVDRQIIGKNFIDSITEMLCKAHNVEYYMYMDSSYDTFSRRFFNLRMGEEHVRKRRKKKASSLLPDATMFSDVEEQKAFNTSLQAQVPCEHNLLEAVMRVEWICFTLRSLGRSSLKVPMDNYRLYGFRKNVCTPSTTEPTYSYAVHAHKVI